MCMRRHSAGSAREHGTLHGRARPSPRACSDTSRPKTCCGEVAPCDPTTLTGSVSVQSEDATMDPLSTSEISAHSPCRPVQDSARRVWAHRSSREPPVPGRRPALLRLRHIHIHTERVLHHFVTHPHAHWLHPDHSRFESSPSLFQPQIRAASLLSPLEVSTYNGRAETAPQRPLRQSMDGSVGES
jgi:hypothetical protein